MLQKNTQLSAYALSFLLLAACKNTQKENPAPEQEEHPTETAAQQTSDEGKHLRLQLEPKSNSDASGTVMFMEKDGIVTLHAELTGLTPGVHAIHLHEKSDCSSDDGTSTGGHWNPTFEQHGKWGSDEGYHRGDIGNFTADADGNGLVHFETDKWCIGCEDDTQNILGKAVIVHEGADDFVTQPTGDAGGRVSCGAIIE